MSESCSRISIQKQELLNESLWLCMERAKYYTRAYKDTEGEHPSLSAAEALKRTLENITIRISENERLVGNRSSRLIAPPIAPEKGDFTFLFKYRLPELKQFGYSISKEDERILFKEIIPYWTGKTVRDHKVRTFVENGLNSSLNLSLKDIRRILKAFGLSTFLNLLLDQKYGISRMEKFRQIMKLLVTLPRNLKAMKSGTKDNVIGRGRCIDTQAHIVVGYKNVLKYGFSGISAAARKQMDVVKRDDEIAFLKSVTIVARAIRDFSMKFARLATRKASETEDENYKNELMKIAAICRKVPWEPPSSFHEALQALWFTQNAIIISYGAGSGITPGRVDQLLYPYYEADISSGKISRAEALELIEEFLIKINNNVVIWPNIAGVKLNHLGSDIENITIGGLKPDGEDGTNELSYLFIEAIKNTKLATTVSFRISKKSPDEFLRKIIELHEFTNGPAFFNDDINVKAMMNDGYSIEDARDYCLVGCVEPSGNGDTFGATGGTKIYFPTIIDLIFNRGKTTFFGHFDTIDTGDPRNFKSFDELMDAFYKQMGTLVSTVAKATNLRDEIWAKNFHNPLISCTIDDCIKNSKDMTAGGAKYNFGAIGGGGLATAVDSLAAIKKLVFDEKEVTMAELIDAIKSNFKNKELLRQKLMNCPKFGNDDDYVDEIAVNIVNRFCEMCKNEKTINGGHFKASFISYGLNVYEGALEPATPNGRKAGEPFSNSISPSNGAEIRGPTAVLNSLAKLDHSKIGFGNSLNMKFPSNLVKSKKGIDSLERLIKTYFKNGGFHVQFNVVDGQTLRDAQKNPEKYQDLIVRVSGYSAYFTRLGKEIQDDLIKRVEFSNF
ncbi:MAG: glycyl radical protein [Promethearchaeota archaeon]